MPDVINPNATSSSERIILNGVDALTGGYLTPPIAAEELAALAEEEYKQTPRQEQQLVRALSDKIYQGPTLGFDAEHLDDLAEARWGLIFAVDEDDRIKQALEPLIKHRAAQLQAGPKIFECRPDWTATDFLAKNGVARGIGEVDKVPYYLLIVGDPSKISFRFQYELDSEYAVGRLCFDSPDDYRAYVERLIDYETSTAVPNSRDAIFWAPTNDDDRATALSSELLVQPLYDDLRPSLGFDKQLFRGAQATKANLEAQFTRTRPPALIFTASHGLGFSKPDPQQTILQGALITQEWQPETAIAANHIFGGHNLTDSANVGGLVHFAFACYGAGTPRHDDFSHGKSKVAPIIANQPFVANLPRQALARGELAFIGHVERAWGYSFIGPQGAPQPLAFTRAIDRLLKGMPVGHALRDMHDKGTQLASSLLEDLNDMDFGRIVPAIVIAEKWKERNDARAHILLGDPGAQLRVQDLR